MGIANAISQINKEKALQQIGRGGIYMSRSIVLSSSSGPQKTG